MGEPNLKDTIGNLKVSEEVLATIDVYKRQVPHQPPEEPG